MTDPNDMHKPGWFNSTINMQSLLGGIFIAVVSFGAAYYGLVGRVAILEERDRQQEIHFGRVETLINEQRSDTRDQLRNISTDVKELSAKLDAWKDQMAGNRPDIKRWTK